VDSRVGCPHCGGMKLPTISILAWLTCTALFAQTTPQQELRNCLVLEQKAQFDEAIIAGKSALTSGQLTEAEMGRAYIMLGFAYHEEGKFNDAQTAFEQSLRIFEHDTEHLTDYASALDDYGGLYGDAGQLDVAQAMWLKALHLREQIGDHAAVVRSLTNLAQVAVAQKRLHQAAEYMRRASAELKSAPDLTNDDSAVFFEAQAWLALSEGHASAAVDGFQRALGICRRTRGEDHWLTGWEHILRGKAYAQSGNLTASLADMRQGLAVLDHALSRKSLQYRAAQLAYSQVLDQSGLHAEAAEMRANAGVSGKDLFDGQCSGCTINMAGFR
jgi:tetratricopeptide (TPR) repeat protein